MRTTIDEVRIIDRHAFQIAIGEIVVTTILCCFVVVGILILTTTVTLIQTDIVRHQLWEDGREVHADSHIVSDVTRGNVEGQDIFHIEVAAVQGILLKLIFNTRDDAHTGDGELIVVAAVDVALTHGTATSPLTNGQTLELHHGVRQHRLIPVDGVHHRRQNTYIGIRSEVVPTLHITVEDVISQEAIQRVLRMLDMSKVVIISIGILWIHFVVDFAGFLIKILHGGDVVLRPQRGIGRDEHRESITLFVRNRCRLLVHVRGVTNAWPNSMVPSSIFVFEERISQSRKLQCSYIKRNVRIGLHHIDDHAVTALQHFRDGLHDTILHRVVLHGEDDV